MRFLASWSGDVHPAFGIMSGPIRTGSMKEIRAGRQWAGDVGTWTKKFNPEKHSKWLARMLPYREQCLFVVVPDVIGDSIQTLDSFRYWSWRLEGWPLAFVGQDGQENIPLPTGYSTLFIGGTTKWKDSSGAETCIKRAQATGKHIHIGRVNWARRYNHFRQMDGSESFTCDGTRNRYEGVEKTTAGWLSYMEQ